MDPEDQTPTRITHTRINLADIGMGVAILIQGIATGVSDSMEYLGSCLASHSLTLAEREQFQKQAGYDIETITRDE